MTISDEARYNLKKVLELKPEELERIETKVEATFNSARSCQFMGHTGILETYSDLVSTVMEFVPRIVLSREFNLNPFWDFVDNSIVDKLKEKCGCQIK